MKLSLENNYKSIDTSSKRDKEENEVGRPLVFVYCRNPGNVCFLGSFLRRAVPVGTGGGRPEGRERAGALRGPGELAG